ncbi:MAG: alpha/beta hydrolase [Myxococcales bacterium]|nr:alpha/beta hydrolase [Myxococcales bacterium]
MIRISPLLLLLGCVPFALPSTACQGQSALAPSIALEPCRPEGFAEEVRCGVLERPEDPARPDGRRVALQIVVLPARASHPKPDPLYAIAGGPGQSARKMGPMLGGLFSQIRKRRDVVLVDQRGTGGSNPLACEAVGEHLPIAARLLEAEKEAKQGEAREVEKCLQSLQDKADLRFYGTTQAIDDLDAVRAALGHEAINLWGISYGTRVALAYLRRYEPRVRSVTLDAVVPPDVILPLAMASGAERALQMTFADCASDPDCGAAFPELGTRFDALVERLKRSPLVTTAPDPLTGELVPAQISADALTSIVRNLLYDPDITSLLPLTLAQLGQGDPRGFLAQANALTGAAGVSEGMHLSVFCDEDFARFERLSNDEEKGAAERDLFGRQVIESYAKSCAVWPRAADVPAALFEPLVSNVPVLILSGALDPVTPPAFGERVKQTLSNARHAVAPGAAHGLTPRGCTAKVIARFVERPEPAKLDVACIEAMRRRPFFLTFAGPKP